MKFYCGVGERVWNHHPVAPGPLACVSPVSGKSEVKKHENWVTIPAGTEVIQDSGAFSDGPGSRLDFQAALDRQLAHAEKHGYGNRVTHRASYDLLIDEKWINGVRSKRRWSVVEAEEAVETTVRAAAFTAKHVTDKRRVLSAQGVSPDQYLDCTRRVLPYLNEDDALGLGGWCIVGIYRSLMDVFVRTINLVIPAAAEAGVNHVHIWGVIYADALGRLLHLCDEYGIELSTDSVGPSVRPVWNKWGYADWIDRTYQRPDTSRLGLDRARHVAATRTWLNDLRQTRYYRTPGDLYVRDRHFAGGLVQRALL